MQALAEHLDVSHPRMSQIVTRKHRPAPELALKISRVTGVPLEDLFGLTAAEIRAGVRAGWERKPKLAKPKRRRAK